MCFMTSANASTVGTPCNIDLVTARADDDEEPPPSKEGGEALLPQGAPDEGLLPDEELLPRGAPNGELLLALALDKSG